MDRYTERIYRLLISSPSEILKEFSSGIVLAVLFLLFDLLVLRTWASLLATPIIITFVVYIVMNRLDVTHVERSLPTIEVAEQKDEEVFDYFDSTKEQTAMFTFNDRVEEIFKTGSSDAMIDTLATRHLQKLNEI